MPTADSNDDDRRKARLAPANNADHVIRPGLLPDDYVAASLAPQVVWHGEAGPFGQFSCRALQQEFVPSALLSTVSQVELYNQHSDEIITVYVVPLDAIPTTMAEELEVRPIAAPIPFSVPGEMIHYRKLKRLRDGFVVEVSGTFSEDEIATFSDRVELDIGRVNALLGK